MSEPAKYRLLVFIDSVPVKAVLIDLSPDLMDIDNWTRMVGGVNKAKIEIELRRIT